MEVENNSGETNNQETQGNDGQIGAGNSEGNSNQQRSQSVPYERFQEINNKYRDLEAKYLDMQAMLEHMKSALIPQQKKGFKLDYTNPDKSIEDYVLSAIEEKLNAFREEGTQKEQNISKQAAINWFRSQEDYTPELEEKAAIFIKENGLQAIDPEKAVKIAYKFVTMGDGSGYIRNIKESLRKPGAGSKQKDWDAKEELAKLDPQDPEYETKMRKIHLKLMGG